MFGGAEGYGGTVGKMKGATAIGLDGARFMDACLAVEVVVEVLEVVTEGLLGEVGAERVFGGVGEVG